MIEVARAALDLWGWQGAPVTLVAQRENHVYRVGDAFALRVHRRGYRSTAELRSELDWMAAVARAGVRVPEPVPTRQGDLFAEVSGHHVSALVWCAGASFGAAPSEAQLWALGAAMARLHSASDAWAKPSTFVRPAWDTEGLVGAAPLWGRFWDHPDLTEDERGLFKAFRDRAAVDLAAITSVDYGLVHADLVRENVLVQGAEVVILDFDDGGWGHRLFDLATALGKLDDPVGAQAPLLAGYRSERAIDIEPLALFLALRAVTYVGWIADRLSEPGAAARSRRNIDDARRAVTAYFEG